MPDLIPVKRALISVSDKTDLLPFVKALSFHGAEIISTGGTAASLKSAGVPVTPIESVTGFPEIMHGRVKTLHPKVHGGILGVRDDATHVAQMVEHGIAPIDLVCVNLYPFEQTIAQQGCTEAHAVENIDIGGPSMLRSAAKNFAWVGVVTSPAQYARVISELESLGGKISKQLRADLAAEAFACTSRYDAAIAGYFMKQAASVFPPLMATSWVKSEELRYGENPHQQAALYRSGTRPHGGSIAWAQQLHGKELSYNNINDADAALNIVRSLSRISPQRCGACVVKHANPCGAALASTPVEAVSEAIAGDPLAAYGGILAINHPLDDAAAQRLCERDIFLEVIIAPSYEIAALQTLRSRWANLRILEVGDIIQGGTSGLEIKSIVGGLLAQSRDDLFVSPTEYTLRAGPTPSDKVLETAAFLEVMCRSLMSNSVVLGGPSPKVPGALRMYGGGAGQMDRLTSCRLACEKAGMLSKGAVAFSDAFFPFPDGPTVMIEAGVKAIIHPGGSKRDDETFGLCEAAGVSCLTTGVRHFRH